MVFSRCTVTNYTGFTSVSKPVQASPKPTFDSAISSSWLFKSEIDYGEHRFTGLLMVKEMEVDLFRAVFTTELGLKIFDLEITPERMVVKDCYEPLNRQRLINLVEQDLRLLFMIGIKKGKFHIFERAAANQTLYRTNIGGNKYYYLEENVTGNIIEMVKRHKGRKPQIWARLNNHLEDVPSDVHISHGKIKMELYFHYIER